MSPRNALYWGQILFFPFLSMSLTAYKQALYNLYNQRSITYDQGEFHPKLAHLLVNYVNIQPGQRVLDLATGTGLVAIEAAKKVGKDGSVVAVDMADLMLAKAQEKAQQLNLRNIDFVQGDIETLELPSEQFDLIFCCAAIPLINNLDKLLSNCYKLLKNGGNLVFNCWTKTSFVEGVILNRIAPKYGIDFPHWHHKTGDYDEIEMRLNKLGFSTIDIKTDQLGNYVELNAVKQKWNMMINFPVSLERLFPFQSLSTEQLPQAKLDYERELESLNTADGIWNDIITLTVIAHKE